MKKIYLALFGLFLGLAAMAQTQTVLPYFQGFEVTDQAETSQWVLNPGAANTAAADRDSWRVGSAVRATGRQALYISHNGVGPYMGDQPVVQYAYRDYLLPAGSYTFTFDWLCDANSSSELAVGYTSPQNQLNASTAAASFPMGVTPSVRNLRGSMTWQSAQFTFATQGGAPVRVYFVWRNNNTNAADTVNFAACVDNVQITNANSPKPEALSVEMTGCDSVKVFWTGYSDSYEFQYRRSEDGQWTTDDEFVMTNDGAYIWLESLSDGAYDFRVRGIINDEVTGLQYYSAYETEMDYPIFCPEQHCINFVNLTDPNLVTCTYGTTGSSYSSSKNGAYANRGVVDFGWESNLSRHTVNWDRTATDPRTGGGLKLVPTGEFASVRLGNWESGGEAESVAYDYVVDSVNSILLVKYACVLEDPDHEADAQPRLVLEVLDEHGNRVGVDDCGQLNFFAGQSGEIWHEYGTGYDAVKWKDWTQIGLNLSQYVGQHIKIRFTTYDCFYSGHYGYAYFTLGCAESTIKINACGESTVAEAVAPEGFDYKWFRADDPTERVLSRNQRFNPTDSAEYVCRMTYKNLARCYFELHTMINPRKPIAEFTPSYEPTNCRNRVRFNNSSFVKVAVNGVWEERRGEMPTEFEWTFPGGATTPQKNPYYDFPKDGGDFDVTLSALLSHGECSHDTTITVHVPAIREYHDTIAATVCFGEHYTFDGKDLIASGKYEMENKTIAGCDSNMVLNLKVMPNLDVILPDTNICFGELYIQSNDTFPYLSSHYWIRNFTSPEDCPYSITQKVTVLDEIVPQINFQEIDEDHEYASISVGEAADGSYSYFTYGGKEYTTLSLDSLEDGNLNLTFYNEHGCALDTTIDVIPGCLRNMIYQRWDDVLSLKNAESRAARYKDLVFVAFQWYKDLEPIPGATKSYYFEPGGLQGTVYSCEVLLSNGDLEMACDFYPTHGPAKITVSPTYLTEGDVLSVSVPEKAFCELYTPFGQKVMSANLVAGDNYLNVPLMQGTYILQVTMGDVVRPYRLTVAQ